MGDSRPLTAAVEQMKVIPLPDGQQKKDYVLEFVKDKGYNNN